MDYKRNSGKKAGGYKANGTMGGGTGGGRYQSKGTMGTGKGGGGAKGAMGKHQRTGSGT